MGTEYNVINDAIKRYRPSGMSMLVTDIKDQEIRQYLVNMTQDLSVNEDKRALAKETVVKMMANRTLIQCLPIFLTQEELLAVEDMCNKAMHLSYPPEEREHKLSRLRSLRRAVTEMIAQRPTSSTPLRWEPVSGKKGEFVDVPNVGRYLIKREEPRSRTWRAFLSGKRTTFASADIGAVRSMVERAVRAKQANADEAYHEHEERVDNAD